MRRTFIRLAGLAALGIGGALSLPLAAHADDGGTPLWQLRRWDRWADHRQEQVRQNIHADQRRDALLDHRQHYLGNQLAGLRSEESQIQDELAGIHGHNHHDRKNRLQGEEQHLQNEAGRDRLALNRTQRADNRDDRSEGMAWWRLHHFEQRDNALSQRIGQSPNG